MSAAASPAAGPVRRRVARATARALATLVFAFLALGYMLFGVANLRPTYPLLEAIAAIAGGAAFLLAPLGAGLLLSVLALASRYARRRTT